MKKFLLKTSLHLIVMTTIATHITIMTRNFNRRSYAANCSSLSCKARLVCVLFSFGHPRCKGLNKKVHYFLHPHKIWKTIIAGLTRIDHILRKHTTHEFNDCTTFHFELSWSTMLNWSLMLDVIFSTMRINDKFCNQAVFVHGLANLQFGVFVTYVIDYRPMALLL